MGELLASSTSRELAEWRAYEQLEPFGPRREDIRAGTVAAMVYNMNRNKDAPVLEAGDFLCPDPVEAQARQTAKLNNQIKAALGGRRQ